MTIIAATMFSGIGAPERAMPHWRWAWSAEIDRFPSAVLAIRHPHSINLGDVTAHDFCERAAAIARPDVIVFGSPCQDFSIAGKRRGLDGARGNLSLCALEIIGRLKPRWFVFENVPGLLSNWSGGPQCPPEPGSSVEGDEASDFAAFLGCVDELRYSGAWASLDAQYRGLAQRRDRLFFVGHSGDWRYPAAVLFEPESLCGDPPSRQQARQDVAGSLGAGSARSGGRVGRREAAAGHVIPICESGKRANIKHDPKNGIGIGADGDPMFTLGTDSRHAVAFGGNDTRGPIDVATARNAHGGPHGRLDFESETFIAHALRAEGSDANEDGTGRGTPLIAAIAFEPRMRSDDGRGYEKSKGAAAGKNQGVTNPVIYPAAVRRLTPEECEVLQGYERGYTAITYRGKPAADGPRYKALGNSQAVPVMQWILSRIEYLDAFAQERAA